MKPSKTILDRIQEEHIQPKPKYYFWILHLLGGLGIIAFLVLGMMANGIIFHFLNHLEFAEFIWQGPQQILKFLWFGIPFLWIFLAAGLLLVTARLVRELKKGYRLRMSFWLLILLVPQVVAGALLERSDMGERLDEIMAEKISFHQTRKANHEKLWSQPSEGFLGGTIVEIQNDSLLLLDDFDQKRWWVSFSRSQTHPRLSLETGQRIKIIGQKTSDAEFVAEKLLPWRRPGIRKRRNGKRRRNEKHRPQTPFHKQPPSSLSVEQ